MVVQYETKRMRGSSDLAQAYRRKGYRKESRAYGLLDSTNEDNGCEHDCVQVPTAPKYRGFIDHEC